MEVSLYCSTVVHLYTLLSHYTRNYYRKWVLWKLYLTAATMSSEIILPIASYVIASVLAVQTVRVSFERAPDKPGYEHPLL